MGVYAHHAEADRTSDYWTSTYSTVSFACFWDASPAEQRELASRLPEAVPAIEQATNSEILSNPIYIQTKDGRAFHRRNGRAVECDVALFGRGLHRSPTQASPHLWCSSTPRMPSCDDRPSRDSFLQSGLSFSV